MKSRSVRAAMARSVAPFHKGDRVKITGGAGRGEEGEVTRVIGAGHWVKVDGAEHGFMKYASQLEHA